MSPKRQKISGIALSPGLAIGEACVFGGTLPIPRRRIKVGEAKSELTRLEKAVEETKKELAEIRDRVRQEIGKREADIFDAHLLFLDDLYLRTHVEYKLVHDRKNLEQALAEVIEESERMLSSVEDAYLRERALDIRDVGGRLLENLLGHDRYDFMTTHNDVIIVADELTPSQAVSLEGVTVRGFVTARGGATSHAAILARSMGVPLVSGAADVLKNITLGTQLIIDGFRGQVILNPTERELAIYYEKLEFLHEKPQELLQLNELPSVTRDEIKISLQANIGSPKDIKLVKEANAEAVGLYRTEVLFLDRDAFPSEDEQFETYQAVVESMAPRCVTIRTMDIGGDKFVSSLPSLQKEANPYLGFRAVRIHMHHPSLFETQMRAILRASAFGNVKIMIPMISCLGEVKWVKTNFLRLKNELLQSGVEFNPNVELGVMVEIPSAALIIDAILRHVDFVSVGTNDLIQYTLAVDRSNEQVSEFYDPLNPAVLQLLKKIGDAGKRSGKDISICGEMAGDTAYTELLLGLGFKALSMSPHFINGVKLVVRALTLSEAESVAQKAAAMFESRKIRQILQKSLHAKGIPEILVFPTT